MAQDMIQKEENSQSRKKLQPDYACVLLAGGRNSRMGGRSKADLSFEGTTIGRRIEDEMEKMGVPCFYSYREENDRIPEGWIPVRDEVIPARDETILAQDAARDEVILARDAASPAGSAATKTAGEEEKTPFSLGPLAGICRALEEAERRGLHGIYVSPCDLPYFRYQMILMIMAKAGGCDAVPGETSAETKAGGSDAVPWETLARAKAGGPDAVLWETRDGRRHYTCGFYSTDCLPAIRKMLESGDLRLRDLTGRVKTGFLSTKEAGIPDFYLANVNTAEQYEKLTFRRKDPPVLCVCGWKDSGKTTLLLELVRQLTAAGIKAAVIKHDGHDFEADYPGTDSFRMKEAGAYGTAVFSEKKFEIVKETKVSAGDLVSCFPEADLILIEGEKYSPYSKIETLRSGSERRLAADPATVLAYVKDWEGEDGMFPEGIPVLQNRDRLDICELVLRWLDQHVFEEKVSCGRREDEDLQQTCPDRTRVFTGDRGIRR